MKRFICIVLCVILCCLSLSCCAATEANNILPSLNVVFGVCLPSLDTLYASHLKESRENADGTKYYMFKDITTEDYQAISQYFALFGCVLSGSERASDTISAKLSAENKLVETAYSLEKQELTVVYPKYFFTENRSLTDAVAGVLPDLQAAFGALLPRVSNVLMRDANRRETLADGGFAETYQYFTEDDYNAFSKYLLDAECQVTNYYTTDRVLTIQLEKAGAPFTVLYDPDVSSITVQYPAGTQAEPGPIYTPAPTPKITAATKKTATPKPTVIQKTTSKAANKSILNEAKIKALINDCPSTAYTTKSTKDFYSSDAGYKKDYPNNGTYTWRITIYLSDGVTAIGDNQTVGLLLYPSHGTAKVLSPIVQWRVKLIDMIPELQVIAKQAGVQFYAEIIVPQDSGYGKYADSNGVIDLCNASTRDSVSSEMHSFSGLIMMFDLLGQMAEELSD